MKREIKFRAWDKHENHYRSWEDLLSFRYNERWFVDNTDKEYINCIFTDSSYILQQFTGLQDCNGKDVYEGDVIEIKGAEYYSNDSACFDEDWEFIGKVEFNSYLWLAADKSIWIPFCDILTEGMDVEIIGNVFENPELLN